MKGFFDELRRRKVSRTAVVYAIVAWAVIEAAAVIFPALHLPDWTVTFVVLLALIGFPVTLIFAWVFDLTREGIVRTPDKSEMPPEQAAVPGRGRLIDFVIIAVLLAVIGWLGWERVFDREAAVGTTALRSIAVLPFANMSGDPENEYFGDGLAEELLNALVKVEGLRVAARTSSFEYKGQHGDVRRIAEALGVDTILEGSVRKAGERVRVTAQLVRADDGFHLWSESYDRNLQDIFAVQDEIALAIVDALRVTLGTRDLERVVARPTRDVEAFEAYLRGRFEMHQRTAASLERAVQEFRAAIARDPQYAAAYSGLSDSWILRTEYAGVPNDESLRQAEPMARRALELDPELAEAHASMGLVLQNKADFAGSIRYLQRAIELNPSYSVAYHWLGLAYTAMGRMRESAEVVRKALEIDPEYLTGKRVLLNAHRRLGEHAEADALAQEMEGRHGENALVLHTLSADAMQRGDLVRAVRLAARGLRIQPNAIHARQLLANQLAMLGDLERADRQMEIAAEVAPDSQAVRLWPAQRALLAGDHDAMAAAMETYLASATAGLERALTACMMYGTAGRAQEAVNFCTRSLEHLGWQAGEAVPASGVDFAAILMSNALRLGDEELVATIRPALEDLVRYFGESGLDPARVREVDAMFRMIDGDPEPFLVGMDSWIEHRLYVPKLLESDPFYAPVRDEPRFIAAVEQLKARTAAARREVDRIEMPD